MIIFGRLLILALVAFEVLNFFGILHFSLDFSWLGLLVTSLGTLLIIESIYYYWYTKGIHVPTFPYVLVVLGLFIDALGDISHFYSRFSWYDQFAHFWGGGAIMAVAIAIFSAMKEKYKLPLIAMLVMSLTFCALLGDLYEIEEYVEDLFRGYQLRLGDGPDTANDIALNLLGGLAVGVVYGFYQKNKKS